MINLRPVVGVGGVGVTCCMMFMCILELLLAPQNCSFQRQKDITFKRLFTMVASVTFHSK